MKPPAQPMTPEEMLKVLSRPNRTSLTAEQMRAMPKEQVIKHALELQGKLDRALSRAYNFGQALTETEYFANAENGAVLDDREVEHA